MAFSFLYLAFRALLGALVRSRRGLDVKDVDLPVPGNSPPILQSVRPFWSDRSPSPQFAAAWLDRERRDWDSFGDFTKTVWRVDATANATRRRAKRAITRHFLRWRDPDSNRGHHDFQGGAVRPDGSGMTCKSGYPSSPDSCTMRAVPRD